MPRKKLLFDFSKQSSKKATSKANNDKKKKEESKPKLQKKMTNQQIEAKVEQRLHSLIGYGEKELTIEKTFGLTLKRSPKVTANDKLTVLFAAVDSKFPGRGRLDERRKLMSQPDLQLLKTFVSKMSEFLFGTQEPQLKVPSSTTTVNYATGVFAVDNDIGWYKVNPTLLSDLAGCFDQVKVEHGTAYYCPKFSAGALETDKVMVLAVGVIDYDSATVLTSFALGLSYDTRKIFCPFLPYEFHETTWEWKGQGIPALQWIITSDASTAVCHWKAITDGGTQTTGASLAAGLFWFDAWCRFRQLTAL